MPLPPIPVDRYLVPASPAAPPEGFARVRQALDRGLPATFRLDGQLTLVLFVPTGDAHLWRDAAGDRLVAAAGDETEPRQPGETEDAAARAAARLVLRRAETNLAALPLRAGLKQVLPAAGGEVGTLVELWILDFALRAGTLRQPGDFGSFIDFAWRRADAGSSRFALPPVDARVAQRFAGQLQSQVGEEDA